ncbi:MAG TPA: sulfotransferase, partial [Anaerolineaceae bacterium]|nr:sulfotransferase [Anaerolineaceae bacterium]
MTFNFKLGLKQTFRAIFRSSELNLALKPRRIIVLTLFIIFFPFIEVVTWFAFWLDKIFYPQFEDCKITNPVFVIGNYRSGTTLLHRYLSFDYQRFTSMTGWEIFIAPSIVQRKLLYLFVAADRFFGSPVVRTFDHLWEKFAQGPVYFHKMGVRDPDEDENLLAHIWSGIIPLNLFPEFEVGKIPGYAYYDKLLNQRQKERIMNFYRGCIQRHLYFHGGKKIYLSKSPSFSGHIETLIEAFPNAKFIYIVRSPYEVVPSSINLWSFKWHVTLEPDEEYPYKDQVLDMIIDYYLHPYEVLKKLPEDRYHFVYYDELMENPETSVQAIYDAFGFQIYPSFSRRLNRIIRRHQNYKRPKEYSLKKMGLSNLKIFENFKSVFKKFKLNPLAGAKLKFSKIPRKWTILRRKRKQK